MSNALPNPEQKRSYVQAMFTEIADRYDFLNSLISLNLDAPWRRKMVRACRLTGSETVLDIGTGSGVSAFALARALRPDGFVLGADFAHGMLRVAQKKQVQKEGASLGARAKAGCAFVNADALELPFPDSTFDAVTSAFVLRNLVDLHKGFADMARVTKSGGRVVALEICRPDAPLLKLLFRTYFYGWVPLLGSLLSRRRDAYTYLPHSLTNFPIKTDLTAIMARAGLTRTAYHLLAGGMAALYVGVKP